MHTYLIATSSVKRSFEQTTGRVNFDPFLIRFSRKLRISSACVRNIFFFHSLNLKSYLYLEKDNIMIENVYL